MSGTLARMSVFVGLLRAINVGGTGKLPMRELVALCQDAGFQRVKTYIQSGNVVFETRLSEAKAQSKLQRALTTKLGKQAGVTLRSADELDAALAHNPFRERPPNRVIIVFTNEALPASALDGVKAPGGEELALRGRELFVYYPSGQGVSKLKLNFAKDGTGRNLNTVTKLAALARAL
jgi:uncharacterized protein (DUF1697 family)